MRPILGKRLVVALVVALSAGTATQARAQAWLPAKGEGSVSVLFQNVAMKYHYFITEPVDRGHIRSDALLLDVTYGFTDRLALSVGIPYVAAKYNGAFPHPLASDLTIPNSIDNGQYHSTFQDFRFDVRYNVTKQGIVLTPYAGTIVPSHSYTYFAHAAPGRDLNEIQVGVLAAKLLDAVLPGLFVQGRYGYGFTERVLDISHNRSVMDLEVGYFVTPRLRVLGVSTGQITHGGVDIGWTFRADNPPIVFVHHDQIDRLNFFNVGGGAAYALTDSIDLFGSMIHTVAQRNGHAIDRGLSIGLSWSFSTGRAQPSAIASASERSLVKCLCEKKTM